MKCPDDCWCWFKDDDIDDDCEFMIEDGTEKRDNK